MKPHVHLVEISIFSLNHVIVRKTKIIKDTRKASTLRKYYYLCTGFTEVLNNFDTVPNNIAIFFELIYS